MNLPELLGFYMIEKHMDNITLAHKCNISPMNIVNIKSGSHTYSQQLVENIGLGLGLNADEMRGFIGDAGFLRKRPQIVKLIKLTDSNVKAFKQYILPLFIWLHKCD